jgi:FAD/FMN-containing dehydrogenase
MTPLDALAEICATRPGEEGDAVHHVRPSLVAEPATAAEAAEVMRAAAGHGLSVVPRGAGTRLRWGAPPSRCDLLIDTRRLDRMIEYAPGDLVVKVEAGMTMEKLAGTLRAEGQRLALDAPIPGSTVGGTLATAAAGPLRLRYGTARDLIIGVTIVRADGAVAKSGGKVVKNVAGYDLGKLLTGSYGTLGLIIEAAFRLHPLPAAHTYVTCEVADFARAQQAVQAVLHSSTVPSAIELDAPHEGPITIAVLVEGVAEGIPVRAEQAAKLLGGDAQADEDPPAWWGRYPDGDALIELTAPPARLAEIMQGAGEGVRVRGSAGSGHWYVVLPGDLPAERAAEVVTGLRSAVARHGGSVIVRVAPDDVRDRLDLWGPVASLALQRRIKDQFDPDHRLAPGRFMKGI